jgi:hypothetical protein
MWFWLCNSKDLTFSFVEEEVEQDLLRAQFDRVEDMIGGAPEFVEEFEDNVIKENYIEEDSDGWGSIDDNPYYI